MRMLELTGTVIMRCPNCEREWCETEPECKACGAALPWRTSCPRCEFRSVRTRCFCPRCWSFVLVQHPLYGFAFVQLVLVLLIGVFVTILGHSDRDARLAIILGVAVSICWTGYTIIRYREWRRQEWEFHAIEGQERTGKTKGRED